MRVLAGLFLSFWAAVAASASPAQAIGPDPDAFREAREWTNAKFLSQATPAEDRGYLFAQLQSGSVERNKRQGHPLRIKERVFATGLHVPGHGTVEVHLPAHAEAFHTLLGVDSNDLSYYSGIGRGAVVVTFEVSGKVIFRSPEMHEGMEALDVDLAMHGADALTIRVKGNEKTSGWDNVDLGDPKFKLSNDREINLTALPDGPLRAAYSLDPPFSFTYGGKRSAVLLKSWNVVRSSRALDAARVEHITRYQDPVTGLDVRCVGIAYRDFPTVEWTVYFRNGGKADTPILEDIQVLDTRFESNGVTAFTLHHGKGAPASPNDYEPLSTLLEPGARLRLAAKGGRPTNQDLSYMNLEWQGGGIIFAIGWPGQWSGAFLLDSTRSTQVRLGQELTHFKLLPGEEVRSPLIAMQFWRGEWIDSQNVWRRWMIAHNLPRPGGRLPAPQLAGNTSHEFVEMTEATAADESRFIDLYAEEQIGIDYFWMDAGWYPNDGSWVNTGTWEVDRKRFPGGLRSVSDHAHARGVGIILWFEPERVTKGSWLYEHHPEWLLSAREDPGDQLYSKDWRLLNLGDAAARQWLTDHVDTLIRDQGVDVYRQDFNMDPLRFWREHDTPDRQGITEIRYVTGYLAYWDELRRRHPKMLLDSCASGGRRNDLETLRRAVPLTRSDYLLEPTEPISQQMQTYGIALWMPFFGTGINGTDRYTFRSQMTPAIVTTWDIRDKTLDYGRLRTLLSQWRETAPDFYGDFYPLTAYSLDAELWAGMQFNRPETGEGMLEAFRRSRSPYESARFVLHGLDPESVYLVTDVDTAARDRVTGRELMETGLEVQLKQKPDAALLTYRKLNREQ